MTDIHEAIQKAAEEIMAQTLAEKDSEIVRLRTQRATPALALCIAALRTRG